MTEGQVLTSVVLAATTLIVSGVIGALLMRKGDRVRAVVAVGIGVFAALTFVSAVVISR